MRQRRIFVRPIAREATNTRLIIPKILILRKIGGVAKRAAKLANEPPRVLGARREDKNMTDTRTPARQAAEEIAAFDRDLDNKSFVACPVCGTNVIDCPHDMIACRTALILSHTGSPAAGLTDDERKLVEFAERWVAAGGGDGTGDQITRRLLAVIDRLTQAQVGK